MKKLITQDNVEQYCLCRDDSVFVGKIKKILKKTILLYSGYIIKKNSIEFIGSKEDAYFLYDDIFSTCFSGARKNKVEEIKAKFAK